MRKLLSAICLLILFVSAGNAFAGSAGEPLRVAVDAPYPPFAEIDKQGNLTGFDVDIANALCAELKRPCIIKVVPFDDIIPGVVAGDIDMGVAGMGPTAERKQVVDFTGHYFRSMSIFIGKKGVAHVVSPAAFKGIRIGVQKGTLQEEYAREQFLESSSIISRPTQDDLNAMLFDGELDIILMDGLPAYSFLKTEAGSAFETIGDPIELNAASTSGCIAVSKKNPKLLQDLDKAIQALRRNGEYGKINRKYFDFNVY